MRIHGAQFSFIPLFRGHYLQCKIPIDMVNFVIFIVLLLCREREGAENKTKQKNEEDEPGIVHTLPIIIVWLLWGFILVQCFSIFLFDISFRLLRARSITICSFCFAMEFRLSMDGCSQKTERERERELRRERGRRWLKVLKIMFIDSGSINAINFNSLMRAFNLSFRSIIFGAFIQHPSISTEAHTHFYMHIRSFKTL